MGKLLRWAGILLAGVALLAGLAAWQGLRLYRAPGPLVEPRQYVVPRGGTQDIGQALQAAGIIMDQRAFTVAAWLTRRDGSLHAAELAFPAGASLEQVLEVLRHARPVQRRVTIAEGLTAGQVAAVLERAEGLTGAVPTLPEGSVLPETYAYQWGEMRTAVAARAQAAMAQALVELWAGRAANLPFTTPQQAVTLASIVERETGLAEERPRVAAVFVNRLRRGMKLQSDPTVVFAATGGAASMDRPISRADLDRDHPYNTYRIPGLPPGPIASPGREALRAVLHPPASEELFFVADGTGGHTFTRTEEEHNRAVRRWREIERARSGEIERARSGEIERARGGGAPANVPATAPSTRSR
jgi:UPF0755 protein